MNHSPDALDALALRCAGAELHAELAALPGESLAELAASEHRSLALLATWERARSFDEAGVLDPAAVETLAAALTRALGGHAPPSWWLEQLASAKLRPAGEGQLDLSGPPAYDVGLREDGDRRGPWAPGPGESVVRSGVAPIVGVHEGQLGYDLSLGRVALGPLPPAHHALELARARAGTTIYWATFDRGSGGVRFPLHASEAGTPLWTVEVCGPDRKVLGGQGYLTVEIVILESPPPDTELARKLGSLAPPEGVAVFSAESHGLAVEVFNPETGARMLAWSSDFWFERGSKQ